MEYAECEAVVKDYLPFREAMKKRGIDDMELVMVDAWLVMHSPFLYIYFTVPGLLNLILKLAVMLFTGVLAITVMQMLQIIGLLNHLYFVEQRVTAPWKMVMHALLKEFTFLLICRIWW